jgi:hypothetical protein
MVLVVCFPGGKPSSQSNAGKAGRVVRPALFFSAAQLAMIGQA